MLVFLLLFGFSTTELSRVTTEPSVIKGIYLSPGSMQSRVLLNNFYRMVDLGLLNTAVLDIKDVRGRVMFSHHKDFIKKAKEKGVYLIARQCVFKDKYFAFKDSGRYALKDASNEIWYQEKCGYWVDPSIKEVIDYNIRITKKAFKLGFDEVQFDYIRYPSSSKPYKNNKNKLKHLLGFLDGVLSIVEPGKKLSLTLYGYAVWANVLAKEGQNLEGMAKKVNAIYPMLYPSHFRNEFMADSTKEWRTYSIVYNSIKEARKRLDNKEMLIIPYIQAFNWKQSRLGKEYIKNQLKAVYDAGEDGFILWEAGGRYDKAFNELIDLEIVLANERLRLY